jgi:GT2 family glycosyltransferase
VATGRQHLATIAAITGAVVNVSVVLVQTDQGGWCSSHERSIAAGILAGAANLTVLPLNSECRILVVAALYQQSPSESNALSSYFAILRDNPAMASHFSLVIYDNSPERHQVPQDFPVHYVHDPANPGLAAAYNYALAQAEETGHAWLLLLDQDTTLSGEFLAELIECANAFRTEDNVAAIVPKLMVRGTILSPAEHFLDFLRHQFRNYVQTLGQAAGIQQGRVSAYNSGSTLSVPVLRSIGGFPKEFWLDYLDHAVFHALCISGRRVYVLHAVLQHDLAESDLNARPIWRFRNVLRAQSLFVKRTGSFTDRLLYRLWLLRSVRRLRADLQDKRIWKETARQALLFNAPDSARYTQEGL